VALGLRQVLASLRAHWWIPVVAALLAGAAALAVNLFLIAPKYTAHTQLFVALNPSTSSPTDLVQGNDFAQARVASYTELLTGDQLAKQLVSSLGLAQSPKALAGEISAQSVPNTVLIDVGVTAGSAAEAQRIARAIDTQFPPMVQQLEAAGTQTSPVVVTVVSPPDLPTAPSSPDVVLAVVVAALGGLLLGVVVVIVRERTDGTVKDADEIEALAEAPVVGVLARNRELDGTPASGAHGLQRAGGRAVAGEEYRQLRARVEHAAQAGARRTILVTSALPDEGKTTVALNLALAMAETPPGVVVVEADFRSPSFSRSLGLGGGTGLVDILQDAAGAAESTRAWVERRCSVIPAGATLSRPGELLGSPAMAKLLVELRAQHDIVLIDAPPVLTVADASVLAPLVDGVLLTVRYGRTTEAEVRQAATDLRLVGGRLLGLVLTFCPPGERSAPAGPHRRPPDDVIRVARDA
jgi:capsular exopolysaccharide synthesis family protein